MTAKDLCCALGIVKHSMLGAPSDPIKFFAAVLVDNFE
jgi:hypothetical protein